MYIREQPYRGLGESVGPFEGTFTGTIRGDKESAATITIVLTDRDNMVTGQITPGKGLKLALGGFCLMEDVDLSSINISGRTSPDNPRYFQTSVKVIESPVNTPTVKSADINVTIKANLINESNTIAAEVTFDPLEGIIPIVGKVDLKKKGCMAKTLPVTLTKQTPTGSLKGYIYDRPLTALPFLRNERPVILRPSQHYYYLSERGLGAEYGALHGSKGSKRPDEVSLMSPAARSAEVQRLTEEIKLQALKNESEGVERIYKRLESISKIMGDEALDLIPNAAATHQRGAAASRALGDMQNWRKRLWRAKSSVEKAVGGTDDNLLRPIIDSLDMIDKNYGSVTIAPRSSKSTSKEQLAQLQLIAVVLSSDPDLRNPDQLTSIYFADKAIKETGSFIGLLPAGYYKVADESFTVENGPTEYTGKKPTKVRWGK